MSKDLYDLYAYLLKYKWYVSAFYTDSLGNVVIRVAPTGPYDHPVKFVLTPNV